MAGAGLEVPLVPECFSGGVKLMQACSKCVVSGGSSSSFRSASSPAALLSERAEAVPLLLLEVRFQCLGVQSRIVVAVELAARYGLADCLLQREFQRVPVVIGNRGKKTVV
jgi:hypothetical protein